MRAGGWAGVGGTGWNAGSPELTDGERGEGGEEDVEGSANI